MFWFIFQLSSLYDMKPPISKAKMTAITKGAIKAVKFYKHIVQSVEKFLQKVCLIFLFGFQNQLTTPILYYSAGQSTRFQDSM